MTSPQILALDFDGVLCDGLLEYFETAWRAYCQVFGETLPNPPAGLADRFYPLRPVVESGWEMPLVLRALLGGIADEAILTHWSGMVPALLAETGLQPGQLGEAVDRVRDRWIQADLTGWLGLHRFYPGVIDRLHQATAAGVTSVIISTKEGRFIQQLLHRQGITLGPEQILGKEVQRPKYETLRQLSQAGSAPIWFVEDRLQALQGVRRQADLGDIQLFLAEWGYNTPGDRSLARQTPTFHSLSLDQFAGPFRGWLTTVP